MITSSSNYSSTTTSLANTCQGDFCSSFINTFTSKSSSKPTTLSILTSTYKFTSTAITHISIESCIDDQCSITSSPTLLESSLITSGKIISSATTVTTTLHGVSTQYTTWCPLLVTCKDDKCNVASGTTFLVEKTPSSTSISSDSITSNIVNEVSRTTENMGSTKTSVSIISDMSSVTSKTSKNNKASTTTVNTQSPKTSSSNAIISSSATNYRDTQSSEFCVGLQCTTIYRSTLKNSVCITCITTATSSYLTPITLTPPSNTVTGKILPTSEILNQETSNTIKSNSFKSKIISSKPVSVKSAFSTSSFLMTKSSSNADVYDRVTSNQVRSSDFSSSSSISNNMMPGITTYAGSGNMINIFGDSIIPLLLLLII